MESKRKRANNRKRYRDQGNAIITTSRFSSSSSPSTPKQPTATTAAQKEPHPEIAPASLSAKHPAAPNLSFISRSILIIKKLVCVQPHVLGERKRLRPRTEEMCRRRRRRRKERKYRARWTRSIPVCSVITGVKRDFEFSFFSLFGRCFVVPKENKTGETNKIKNQIRSCWGTRPRRGSARWGS